MVSRGNRCRRLLDADMSTSQNRIVCFPYHIRPENLRDAELSTRCPMVEQAVLKKVRL
jgi:hypothetical protein